MRTILAAMLILSLAFGLPANAGDKKNDASKSKPPSAKSDSAPKSAPKAEPKVEPKVEPKPESKPAPKEEAKAEVPAPMQNESAPKPDAAKPANASAKPATPAKPGDQKEEQKDPLASIFGDGGVNVKADKIYSEINPDTSELKTMHMQVGVVIKSEQMNIDCDDLFIDMEKQQMVAKGQLVKFDKTDVNGTCGRLTYDIENKKTFLEGKPKPEIIQKDANGQIKKTRADRITMVQSDKANNVTWDGSVEFEMGGNPTAPAQTPKAAESPSKKIDDNSVDQIRTAPKSEKAAEKTEKSRSPVMSGK